MDRKELQKMAAVINTKTAELKAMYDARNAAPKKEHGLRRELRRRDVELANLRVEYANAYKTYKAEQSAAWADEKARKAAVKLASKQPSPMHGIRRLKIVSAEMENISIFSSDATRHIEAMGHNVSDDVMKICSLVPNMKDRDCEADRVYADMIHYAAAGFVDENGKFLPVLAGASDSRKAQATWLKDEIAADYWKWSMCGLTLAKISGKIAVNKYMAYQGLLWSASKAFKKVYGVEIDPGRIAVVDDGYVEVTGIMDVVHEDGTVEKAVKRTVRINAFDGFGVIRAELTDGESVTIRGPWIKAFIQAACWDEIVAYAKEHIGTTRIKTLYGEKNIEDCDIIMCKSCFKAAKLYDSWEEYEKAFKELGHTISVCVREHKPHLKGMPYQQGQTLAWTDDDVEKFAQHSLRTVQKYEDLNQAVTLLSGYHRECAKLYPALMKEVYTARTIQDRITSMKNGMLGGKIPELGYNSFLAPDMTAFVEHLCGLPIKGSLAAGECCCLFAKDGVLTDITRSPHLDNAHCLLVNVHNCAFVPAKTPTMFINVVDLTTIRLRADYDGDHVWWSQNADLVDLCVRTAEVLGNLPIDWEAPESAKGVINKATIAEFIANMLKGSEIGLYADALTKMWANGYNREVCDWLTYAGNVLIDAAKHGNVKIEKPEAVEDVDGLSLPWFAQFAKADKERPALSEYWTAERVTKKGTVLPPRCVKTDSGLDKYSERVMELVPNTVTVRGTDELVFDVQKLLIKPGRKTDRLNTLCMKVGEYNPETGEYEDVDGLFQQIAFRQSAEWKEIISDENLRSNYQEWEKAKAEYAKQEIVDWVRAQYFDVPAVQEISDRKLLEAAYDIICRRLHYEKMSDGLDTVMKSAFWRIFGDMAYETLCRNLGTEALSMDFSGDDSDFD